MSEQDVKIKELEDKINELTVKNTSLEDELKSVKGELEWVTEQYGILLSATFSEIFDLAAKVKNQSLHQIIERRNSPQ